jgi:hypothetical protein
MFPPPSGPHGSPNNQIPKQICAQGSLLNIYVYFLFLDPFVSQKNAKNQYALLPGIYVTVLASHFSSVIDNFRSSGRLDLHV